jgi:hypothetical protein
MTALKACPHPPDISSISICWMFILDLRVSDKLSAVMPDDEAFAAACVSVSAAIGVARNDAVVTMLRFRTEVVFKTRKLGRGVVRSRLFVGPLTRASGKATLKSIESDQNVGLDGYSTLSAVCCKRRFSRCA